MRPTAIVVMFGFNEGGEPWQLVQQARLAATLDLLERCISSQWDRVIFCSNRPELLSVNGLPLERVQAVTEPFHFGRELQLLIRRCRLEDFGVLYLGGGLPLLGPGTLEKVRTFVCSTEGGALANNIHSCDFAGWGPGEALLHAAAPDTDNDLAWQLRRIGLEAWELPRSAETLFDVDTPADLLLLSLSNELGPRLRALLHAANLDSSRVRATLEVLRDFERTVLCYGRLSHHAWAYFAQHVACQTRIFSEERGMRASGRLARGEVRSLLGFAAEAMSWSGLFAALCELAHALIIDTRVLMAHFRRWPRAEDRFYSDLLMPEHIGDPWLRELTEAAAACPVPVLLGGHCLVSGGLYLLADAVGPKELPRS